MKKQMTEIQEASLREYAEDLFGRFQCFDCKHWRGMCTCSAFPKSIPLEIVTGHHDHRQPYPNAKHPIDGGIRFESKNRSEKS